MINLGNKQSKITHWASLSIDKDTVVYFDSLEYILPYVLSKIKDKFITNNIFRIQSDDSIMCGFYCTAFIEYVIAGKTLFDYTNSFSPNDHQKNEKNMYKYFKQKYAKRKCKP